MSNKKHQTLVVEYEGDQLPWTGFSTLVLGCPVVAASCDHGLDARSTAEIIVEEVAAMLENDDYEKEDISNYINSFVE